MFNSSNDNQPKKQFDRYNDMWSGEMAAAESHVRNSKVKSELPNTVIHYTWDELGKLTLDIEIPEIVELRKLLKLEVLMEGDLVREIESIIDSNEKKAIIIEELILKVEKYKIVVDELVKHLSNPDIVEILMELA